ncbi:NAD(P)-binding domain-containing protein [Niabella hibiscisoli]|nr:NAD(P)-binding domain-containing protein [Niabella hibiscisoli]
MYGKTLGVFGLGNIGYEMAIKCKAAFGMNIIYHNRKPNAKAEQELDATYVSFEELLTQSDVLTLHANLSDTTKGIFNKQAFSKMKSNAIFINTGRGGLHNETDLKEALDAGTIWGAGLDVTNPEPMDKDNPLLTMPNVCILPHIGSATQEARNGMAVMAAKNVIAGLKNEPLPTIVNPDVYHQ